MGYFRVAGKWQSRPSRPVHCIYSQADKSHTEMTPVGAINNVRSIYAREQSTVPGRGWENQNETLAKFTSVTKNIQSLGDETASTVSR